MVPLASDLNILDGTSMNHLSLTKNYTGIMHQTTYGNVTLCTCFMCEHTQWAFLHGILCEDTLILIGSHDIT